MEDTLQNVLAQKHWIKLLERRPKSVQLPVAARATDVGVGWRWVCKRRHCKFVYDFVTIGKLVFTDGRNVNGAFEYAVDHAEMTEEFERPGLEG